MRKSLPWAASLCRLALAPFTSPPLGTERLPERGPLLVAANHQSFLDGVLLATVFVHAQKRPLHLIAYDEPFRNPFFGHFLRCGGCIPFHRGDSGQAEAMIGVALACLTRGEAVGIFPEGHINPRPRLRRARPGMAVLALAGGVPVCPAGIVGSDAVVPAGRKLPRFGPKARVVFGDPLCFDEEAALYASAADHPGRRAELLASVTGRVMAAISELCGKTISTNWK